jgi:hypothetical protein
LTPLRKPWDEINEELYSPKQASNQKKRVGVLVTHITYEAQSRGSVA